VTILTEYYMDQPAEVGIETMTLCNAACTFCPYPTMERKGDKMSGWLLDKLIEEMMDFKVPFFVSPFKVNEPLLDKRFYDVCRTIEAGTLAWLRLFSNGSALTQKRIDEISQLERVHHMVISLNSHIPEEYEELMSMPFHKTAKRLDNLHNQDFPHPVLLTCVGWPNRPFCDYVRNRWPKFKPQAVPKTSWLGYTESQAKVVPDLPCSRWFELSVMANGVVSLCCQDGEGQFPIGDVNKQTLLEVYNSPFYRERREKQLSRLEVPVCNTCTYGSTLSGMSEATSRHYESVCCNTSV
jgi:sulfatase maturation enzyme AslB (radical SAM superfamily)